MEDDAATAPTNMPPPDKVGDSAAVPIQHQELDGPDEHHTAHDLEPLDAEVVEGIVEKAAERAAIRAIASYYLEVSTSPLPAPGVLRELEATQTGLINTTVEIIQAENTHRRRLQQQDLDVRESLAKRGQIIGGFLGSLIVVAAVVIILTGHDVVGLATLVTGMAPILYAFLTPTLGRSALEDEDSPYSD